ncbi:NAD(P)/FAD-dependent oxidoreductase [Kushneria indalinina]|uniref:Gamma-glutamylputrescine oxidase n=1 Tax=Kushneria indalinina DSM 14324 TaxID=1122140 RepID=A0A3D9E0K0_9GAMM|nr:FAD-binding oxidoreductase [Kushneria indalinina]REC96582.1 gamma-glutamylputrescine oxidase [Kushneria indalinina DSM 14324]
MSEHSWYAYSRNLALDNTAPLAGAQRFDVAIIGGGVTGCSAALHLAERGYRVALLEAGEIGAGASGRSGGQILPGLGTELSVIEKSLGHQAARDIWAMSREAVRLTESLIERHDIDCEYSRGYLHAAIKPRHERAMKAWRDEMATRYGYEGLEWLEGEALRRHVVTDAYLGGLYEREAGHLHPLNYTLGLARAAQRAGAVIFEHSRVSDITRGKTVQLTTAHGQIDCDHLLVAGNAYLGGLVPEIERKIMPVVNYIIATEALSEHQVAQTLPQRDAVSDANFVLDYYRLTAGRRLLYGGQVSYSGREPRGLVTIMQRKMRELFPVLEDVAIDYRWGGRVAITRSRAPHFGRLDDNIYFVQGYSGHGMALAGLAGQLMAQAVAGQRERFDLLAAMKHLDFPGGRRLRTPLLVLATAFYRLRDRL